MYLGADESKEVWTNPVAVALGLDGTKFEFIVSPYFVTLFTPFLLASVFLISNLLVKLGVV